MRPWFAAVIAVSAAFALASPSPAQSLAEVAARTKQKEKEDKEKSGKPAAKVYTESDLRGSGSGTMSQMEGPVATASPAPGATAAATGVVPPAGEKVKTEDELRAEAQAAWRERLSKAEADVARINDDINRAQTALNDISGPLYGGTRAGLITRLEDDKRQLAAAQQAIADLQEEGRRARYR
jgi:hypothetical protein